MSNTKTDRVQPRRKPRRLFRVIGLLFALVLSLVMVEALLSGYAYWKFRTLSVKKIHELDTGNTYITDLEKDNTSWVQMLFPHPYLAFVRTRGKAEPLSQAENAGLMGRDFPLARDPEKFTILLTGGSVAAQLSQSGNGPRSYLEEILNERYDFGKEVVVINGANGGWKQPHQTIVLMLCGDAVDAVITLEGFNEHHKFRGNRA